MKCPKCKTTDLEKTDYNSPWFCETCGGLWLISLEKSTFADMLTEDIAPLTSPGNHDNETGICPSGHGIMIRARVDINKPF